MNILWKETFALFLGLLGGMALVLVSGGVIAAGIALVIWAFEISAALGAVALLLFFLVCCFFIALLSVNSTPKGRFPL